MKLLVCIKWLPETDDINPADAAALEAALAFREDLSETASGGSAVDVVTLGPARAEHILRKAFGMGADRGLHILWGPGDYLTDPDPAPAIAALAASYDLVLTGIMSEDRMAGQTASMLAALLEIPCAAGVIALRPTATPGDSQSGNTGGRPRIRVERELENGRQECLEICLPCVLAVQSGAISPRYPSLSLMLAGKHKEITTIDPEDLYGALPPFRDLYLPPEVPARTREGRKLPGSLAEKAAGLMQVLHQKDLL